MTRFALPTDRLQRATDRQAGFTEERQAGDIRDFTPRFFSDEGKPSLDAPQAGSIIDATGLRIGRGAAEMEGAWSWAVQSIGQWVSDGYRSSADVSFPAQMVGDSVITERGPVRLEDATVGDIYDAADDWTKATLQAAGIDRQRFISATEDDPRNVDETYRKMVQSIRTDQALAQYADRHEAAYWGAGALAAITDLIDPLTILTVGAGTIAVQASKQGVKQGARLGLRESAKRSALRFSEGLKRGSFGEALTMATFPIRQLEYHKLMIPAAGLEGAAFNTMAQMAQHEASLRVGEIEENTPFELDPLGLFTAAGLGMGLYGIAYKRGGLREVAQTPREYLNHNQGTYGATVMRRYVDEGRFDMDEVVRPETIANLSIIERLVNGMYGLEDRAWANKMRQVLDEVDTEGGVKSDDLAVWASKLPTRQEMEDWLNNPSRSLEDTTAISRAMDGLRDANQLYRDALAEGNEADIKKYRRAIDRLEAEQVEAMRTMNTVSDLDDPLLVGNIRTRPLTNIAGSGADRKARTEFLVRQMVTRNRAIGGVTQDRTQWVYKNILGNLGGDLLSPTANARKAAQNPIDETDEMLAAVYSLVVNDATDLRLAGRRGAALSFKEAYTEVQINQGEFLSVYDRHTRRMSQEDKEAFGSQVLRYLRDRDDDLLDPAIAETAQALRRYYDLMAEQGLRNGYLSSKVDNYLSVNFRPGMSDQGVEQLGQTLANRWFDGLYDPDNADSVIHMRTLLSIPENQARQALEDMGIDTEGLSLDDLFDLDLEGQDLRLSSLPDEYMESYQSKLRVSLQEDAESSVRKRIGRDTSFVEDPLIRSADQPRRILADSRGQRKIEQDVWLSDENLESGLIETDLEELVQFYDRSTGYNIARQEALLDAFDEPVRWDDLLKVLRDKSDDGGRKAAIYKGLVQMETVNAGRVPQQDKSFAVRVISGLGRATVNMGVGLPILTTEVATTLAQSMFNSKDIRENARMMVRAFVEGVDDSMMRQMGFGYEVTRNHHRMFGDLRDREILENAVGFQGKLGKAVLAYEDWSRIIGMEYYFTKHSKAIRFNQGFSTFHFRRAVLDKGEELRLDVPYDSKEFRDSARRAGFGSRHDIARDLAEKGLMDPEMLQAARAIRQIDKDALLDLRSAHTAARKIDDDQLRKNAVEFIGRLRRYGTDFGEQMITTGDASTMRRFNSDIANLFFQFLSFPQAWYSKTLRRMADSPVHTQLGYLGLYVIGEMNASILRDIAYNGHSPETVLETWENDPLGEMTKIVGRVPFFGPWNQVPQLAINQFVGDPDPIFTPGAAAPSMIFRGAGAISSTIKDLQNGEPIRDSSERTYRRLVPGYNHWAIRFFEGMVTGADSDRE